MKKHLMFMCFLIISIMILSSCKNDLTNATEKESASSSVPEDASLTGNGDIHELTDTPSSSESLSYNFLDSM